MVSFFGVIVLIMLVNPIQIWIELLIRSKSLPASYFGKFSQFKLFLQLFLFLFLLLVLKRINNKIVHSKSLWPNSIESSFEPY
jgi:hypothetical protein